MKISKMLFKIVLVEHVTPLLTPQKYFMSTTHIVNNYVDEIQYNKISYFVCSHHNRYSNKNSSNVEK